MLMVYNIYAALTVLSIVAALTDNSHDPCSYSWFVYHDINLRNMLITQPHPTIMKHRVVLD